MRSTGNGRVAVIGRNALEGTPEQRSDRQGPASEHSDPHASLNAEAGANGTCITEAAPVWRAMP